MSAAPFMTASGAQIVKTCPPSAALQHAKELRAEQRGGHALARFAASLETLTREEAIAAAPEEERAWLSTVDVERMRPAKGTWAAEVTLVFDVLTGEAHELGRQLERGYAHAAREKLGRDLRPSEVVGTADLVALADNGKTVVVTDDKRDWAAHVPPAREAWQLLVLAVAGARAYGCNRARVGICRIIDGEARWSYADLSRADLLGIAAELRELYHQVEAIRAAIKAGETPVVTVGDHCGYCPALRFCPAHKAALAAASSGDLTVLGTATDDELAHAWDKVKAVRRAADQLEETLRHRARQRPFALTSGKWLGPKVQPGTPSYDGRKVYGIIAQRFGKERAEAAVEISTSAAAIERALRDLPADKGGAPPRGWTKWLDDLLDDLFEAGAATRGPARSSVVEFKPKKEQLEQLLLERHEREVAAAEEPNQLEQQAGEAAGS